MCQEPKADYVHFSLRGAFKCCTPVQLFDEYFLAVGTSNGVCSLFKFQSNTHAAKNEMCQEPKADYVHFSLRGAFKCCTPVQLFDEYFLAVGTSNGVCSLFKFQSNTHAAVVYEDEEERQIMALGQIGNDDIFVHVRAFAVLLIRVTKSKKALSFEIANKWPTAHYGFCRTIASASDLVMPCDNTKLKVVSVNDDEKTIDFSSPDLKECGVLTCFCLFVPNLLVLGFEKGALAVFDMQESHCMQKAPLEKGMLQFFLISARGCESLCFSPCGKQLASGYWDGSVRIHSVRTGNVRVLVNLHSSLITYLCWASVHRKRLLFICSEDMRLSIWNLHKDP
ncbi:hypothetical protein Tcan_16443 [Toxocara canis]|uniref:Anaphase-promoting complex subunit 4-like WD40 domain-containing protein n=1 Tax=Toxocara canis TaxID=6265 RepID=A0A0B2W4X1_TOXCA|nr:hypothetical protein Tcan_16443 [Toxocara canis]